MMLVGFERASAAANFTMSPTSGPPGSSVTISATDFAPNTNTSILFDFQLLEQVTTNSLGDFTEAITIPSNTSVGSHTITVNDGANSVNKSFTVTAPSPAITLSPTSGTTGTTVTVSGSNFGVSKTITIKFDNNNITTNPNTVTSTNTGTFSATITIPSNTSVGSHTISAADNTNSASATFSVVVSGITLSVTSGGPSSVVTVTGTNFGANKAITIKFDNTNIATTPSSVTSSGTGTFSASITVPSNTSVGSHTISVTDGTTTQSATFTVVATSITLSSTQGIIGSTVTVSGAGFVASSSITIKLDTSTLPTTPSNVSTNSSGAFSATITIPSSTTAGDHTITATDSTGKIANATFKVLAAGTISLSPTSGNRGATVTVTGSSFNSNSAITIQFDDTTLTTTPSSVTTSSGGTFTATIKIPITASTGTHTIKVTDAAGKLGTATFTVAAGGTITLSPTKGITGTEITVTGSDFATNARITSIEFDEIVVATTPRSVATNTNGGFSAKFLVPAGVAAGSHIVVVIDDTGNVGVATFTVEGAGASITISPTSGVVGTLVTITGSNFAANTAVTVKFDGVTLTTNPISITTASNGGFTASVTIPNISTGSHTVTVTVGSQTATATFTITQAQPASITISPTSGTVGNAITITGSGFLPNKGITINLDGSLVATATSSSSGTFSALFTISSTVSSGSHTITASDGNNTVSATLSITGTSSNVVNVSQVKMVDQTGTTLSRPAVGMQVLVQSDVKNTLATDQQFAYIVQIKDSGGSTIMISWMTGTLPPGKQYSVAQSWLIEDEGEYTAEVFVWQSISNPVILAPMQKINFDVR